jgi:MFS family permease
MSTAWSTPPRVRISPWPELAENPSAYGEPVGTYGRLLRLPHVAPLLATNALSRLPIGITGLAVVLYLRAQTGSFAIGGAVAGAVTLGLGVFSPVVGRLVDRRGEAALGYLSIAHAAGLVALLALGHARAHTGVLLAVGFATGATLPPTASLLRARWPELTAERPDLLTSAYALEAVLIELLFVSGPLIVGLLVIVANAGAALAVSAVAVVVGTWSFLGFLPPRAVPLDEHGEEVVRPRLGALASPGIRTIVFTMVPVGFAFGLVEVSMPALARADGSPELAGLLLSVWSGASALGGIVWGASTHVRPIERTNALLACLLPLGFAPVLLSGSVPLAALLIIPAGVVIAPLIATRNELAGRVSPPGASIEAFTWPTTALLGGISAGTALGGALADGPGWRAGVVVAVGMAALGAVVTVIRQKTLEPAAIR